MKFTVNINQKAAIDLGLDLDIIDLAIFDYIKDFSSCAACTKMQFDDGTYFWISNTKIINDMPILRITTTRGISKRVSKLVAAGVLKRHPDCDKLGMSLYTAGSNFDALIFEKWGNNAQNDGSDPRTNVPTPERMFQGPPNSCSGGPPNERSTYYNIYNNNNNILRNSENEHVQDAQIEQPSLFSDLQQEECNDNNVPTFEQFWTLYDKKRGRDRAERLWNKLSHADKKAIMEYIPKYISSQPDKQYRKDPSTFLNGRAWMDEIVSTDIHKQQQIHANGVIDPITNSIVPGLTKEAWESISMKIQNLWPAIASAITPSTFMKFRSEAEPYGRDALVSVLTVLNDTGDTDTFSLRRAFTTALKQYDAQKKYEQWLKQQEGSTSKTT